MASKQNKLDFDYGLRFYNPQRQGYDYFLIVSAGDDSKESPASPKVILRASRPNQTHFALLLARRFVDPNHRQRAKHSHADSTSVELEFSPDGSAQVSSPAPAFDDSLGSDPSGPWQPLSPPFLIKADPPARFNQPRFAVWFGLEESRGLWVSVDDLERQTSLHRHAKWRQLD